MKIKIYSNSNQYHFSILKNDIELFNSKNQYNLSSTVKPYYKYAWSAYRDGINLVKKQPYHIIVAMEDLTKNVMVDVSAEEKILDHYERILKYIRQKIKGSMGNDNDMNMVYNEIKMVKAELKVLVEKIKNPQENKNLKKLYGYVNMLMKRFFSKQMAQEPKESQGVQPEQPIAPKIASVISSIKYKMSFIQEDTKIDDNAKIEILNSYGEKACEALQDIHSNIMYEIDNKLSKITLFLIKDKNVPILDIFINNDLLIYAIKPYFIISEMYPYHSLEFYQRYLKPIIEKIGHYYLVNNELLMLSDTMPDIPNKSLKKKVKTWDIKGKCIGLLDVSFDSDNNLWTFDTDNKIRLASSLNIYNEKDFFNAIVKCIDSNLKSIHGRTGVVVQTIPHVDFIELDVDFGRGIGMVRLTDKQIEIVKV